MAHHTDWNLGGEDAGSITGHELTLSRAPIRRAIRWCRDRARLRPSPGRRSTSPRPSPSAANLQAAGGDPVGYDHNFVVDGDPERSVPSRGWWTRSGRVPTVDARRAGGPVLSRATTSTGPIGQRRQAVREAQGLCLETQAFPNAINVPAWRDQVILRPGKPY